MIIDLKRRWGRLFGRLKPSPDANAHKSAWLFFHCPFERFLLTLSGLFFKALALGQLLVQEGTHFNILIVLKGLFMVESRFTGRMLHWLFWQSLVNWLRWVTRMRRFLLLLEEDLISIFINAELAKNRLVLHRQFSSGTAARSLWRQGTSEFLRIAWV